MILFHSLFFVCYFIYICKMSKIFTSTDGPIKIIYRFIDDFDLTIAVSLSIYFFFLSIFHSPFLTMVCSVFSLFLFCIFLVFLRSVHDLVKTLIYIAFEMDETSLLRLHFLHGQSKLFQYVCECMCVNVFIYLFVCLSLSVDCLFVNVQRVKLLRCKRR